MSEIPPLCVSQVGHNWPWQAIHCACTYHERNREHLLTLLEQDAVFAIFQDDTSRVESNFNIQLIPKKYPRWTDCSDLTHI